MPFIRSSSLPALFARAGLALGLAVAGQAVFMPAASAATPKWAAAWSVAWLLPPTDRMCPDGLHRDAEALSAKACPALIPG